MKVIPKPQEIYKHFKGNLYQIIALAEHSETGEEMVVYQALYGESKVYVRPLQMFVSKVDKEKYPDVEQEYRFQLQEAQETQAESREEEEIPDLDPLLLEFLDADSHDKKINILNALSPRITDDMITIMAVACDVEIPDGSLEKRVDELRSCLMTLEKYEIKRV